MVFGSEVQVPARGDDGTLLWLLEHAVYRWGGNLAVDDPTPGFEMALSYRELWSVANDLAARLQENGVTPGDRVIISGRTPGECIVAMHASLLGGAVYVPVTRGCPEIRAEKILNDCQANIILGSGLKGATRSIEIMPKGRRPRKAPLPVRRGPDDVAYLLYTSGSTGTPKGVCITHRNSRAFVDWAVAQVGVGPEGRLANHSSFSFDLSVFDVFGSASAGACVVPVPFSDRSTGAALTRFLHTSQVTTWYSVPSAISMMLTSGGLGESSVPSHLRTVLFAGEPFPGPGLLELANWAGPRVDLLNLYGPTETNVVAAHRLSPRDRRAGCPPPIGVAVSGAKLGVAPIDDPGVVQWELGPEVVGELVVDGPTVSPGYWGRAPRSAGPYWTGDLVRRRRDGVLEFRGRLDDMLKIRGHRVEPGDVEAAACSVPGVSEACAVAATTAEGTVLALAYEPGIGTCMGAGATPMQVRRGLSERLPSHLMPDDVVKLDVLPRTERGKLDRAAVRERIRCRKGILSP